MWPQELCPSIPPSTLTHSPLRRGQLTILQGSVELSSQLRAKQSLHHSPSMQIPLSLCCLLPGGSRCCLELSIIRSTPDSAAFKPLWPRDPKPTPQRSHPASIQLCAEASAASPRGKASVPVRGNRLSSLYSPDEGSLWTPRPCLYVCHSIQQAACSWPRCDCTEKGGSAAIWGS